MSNSTMIREFKTRQFTVRVTARPDDDLDLSWDETGETAQKLATGEYQAFSVHVTVYCRGDRVGEDSLYGCIYADPAEFQDHRQCGRENKRLAAKGVAGRCGSYFHDMIREAIADARKNLTKARPYIRRNTLKAAP